jgi:copper(I)-binding protein
MRYSVLAAALLAVMPALALAQAPAVKVEQAWTRAGAGVGGNGAVYLTLTAQREPDRLIGADTPQAGMAMLHQTTTEGGVTRMREVEGVALPAGHAVTLRPGGTHIMLMDIKQKLKPGDSFPLSLAFEKAPTASVTVSVLKPGARGPAAGQP